MVELFNTLFKPFANAVKQQTDAPGSPTFVSWIHYVVRGWNQFPQGYSKEITHIQQITGVDKEGNRVDTLIVGVRITDEESLVSQTALGSADCGKTSWGGAVAEAESQAFRRAMANFGMGLEMYMDEDEFNRTQRALEAATGDGEPEADSITAAKINALAVDTAPIDAGAVTAPKDQAATDRQMEVLGVLGKQLAALGEDDEAIKLFVTNQKAKLSQPITKAKAGVVIAAFREKYADLGYADPTKSDGAS
jgi:hypothetical protein